MEIEVKNPEEMQEKAVFGKTEEYAIISLAFDQPEFFSSILQFMKSDFFQQFEARFVFDIINYHWQANEVVLSRAMARDIAQNELTADDPFEGILGLIDRESDPREVPIITDKLMGWAKRKSMLQLYETDVVQSVERGEFEDVERIIEESRRITNIGNQCHFFFNELEELFVKDTQEKFTTGFGKLDMALNEGGPARGEVFCWMAPTGVGKSITLVNTAVGNIKRRKVVLYITLEMTWIQTGVRFLCCFSNVSGRERFNNKDLIMKKLSFIKTTYDTDLILAEFPPDEISSDHIHALIDMIRKIHGVNVDVVVVDYLELLMSRQPAYNKDDYVRQKRACTELDRLAKKEKVIVFTATQTNRSGNEGQAKEQLIDVTKAAESYGKVMPISYLVSINQTQAEYEAGKANQDAPVTAAAARFFIAKNRNGPKFLTINARINYETMRMMEYEGLNVLTDKLQAKPGAADVTNEPVGAAANGVTKAP